MKRNNRTLCQHVSAASDGKQSLAESGAKRANIPDMDLIKDLGVIMKDAQDFEMEVAEELKKAGDEEEGDNNHKPLLGHEKLAGLLWAVVESQSFDSQLVVGQQFNTWLNPNQAELERYKAFRGATRTTHGQTTADATMAFKLAWAKVRFDGHDNHEDKMRGLELLERRRHLRTPSSASLCSMVCVCVLVLLLFGWR